MESTEEKPRRKWLTCLIVLAIVASMPVFLLLGWIKIIYNLPTPPLVISKETTYVTGPPTVDGHVDYFKALEERCYPQEMKSTVPSRTNSCSIGLDDRFRKMDLLRLSSTLSVFR